MTHLFTRAELDEITADLTVEATLREDIELMPLDEFGNPTFIRECMEAAEKVLARDWNTPEEDEAWEYLSKRDK